MVKGVDPASYIRALKIFIAVIELCCLRCHTSRTMFVYYHIGSQRLFIYIFSPAASPLREVGTPPVSSLQSTYSFSLALPSSLTLKALYLYATLGSRRQFSNLSRHSDRSLRYFRIASFTENIWQLIYNVLIDLALSNFLGSSMRTQF